MIDFNQQRLDWLSEIEKKNKNKKEKKKSVKNWRIRTLSYFNHPKAHTVYFLIVHKKNSLVNGSKWKKNKTKIMQNF